MHKRITAWHVIEPGEKLCHHCFVSLVLLSFRLRGEWNEGYVLDMTDGRDHAMRYLLFGAEGLIFCWARDHFIMPVYYHTIGRWRQARLRRLLQHYPKSRICTYCHYVDRRR